MCTMPQLEHFATYILYLYLYHWYCWIVYFKRNYTHTHTWMENITCNLAFHISYPVLEMHQTLFDKCDELANEWADCYGNWFLFGILFISCSRSLCMSVFGHTSEVLFFHEWFIHSHSFIYEHIALILVTFRSSNQSFDMLLHLTHSHTYCRVNNFEDFLRCRIIVIKASCLNVSGLKIFA